MGSDMPAQGSREMTEFITDLQSRFTPSLGSIIATRAVELMYQPKKPQVRPSRAKPRSEEEMQQRQARKRRREELEQSRQRRKAEKEENARTAEQNIGTSTALSIADAPQSLVGGSGSGSENVDGDGDGDGDGDSIGIRHSEGNRSSSSRRGRAKDIGIKGPLPQHIHHNTHNRSHRDISMPRSHVPSAIAASISKVPSDVSTAPLPALKYTQFSSSTTTSWATSKA